METGLLFFIGMLAGAGSILVFVFVYDLVIYLIRRHRRVDSLFDDIHTLRRRVSEVESFLAYRMRDK